MSGKRARYIEGFLVLLFNFLCGFHLSFVGPLFPSEAHSKGVSKTLTGVIFGTFDLTCVIAGFLLPPIVNYLKLNTIFTAGLLTLSLGYTAFGFSSLISNTCLYIIVTTLIRIVVATGFSVSFFAMFPIFFTLFPDSKGEITALTQVFFEIGMISGSCCCGFLFSFGGFPLPFATLGVLTLILALLCLSFLSLDHGPSPDDQESKPFVKSIGEEFSNVTIWDLLFNRKLQMATIPILFSWALQGTIFVFLNPFLMNIIGVDHNDVGYYFLPMAITGLFVSPILGKIADKGHEWVLYTLSPVFGLSVCTLLLLVMIKFPEPYHSGVLLSALCITSVCYVAGFISGVKVLLQVIQQSYPRESESSCTALMSAWNNILIMCGRMFGCIVMGGALFDVGGYKVVLWTQGSFHVAAVIAALMSVHIMKSKTTNVYNEIR